MLSVTRCNHGRWYWRKWVLISGSVLLLSSLLTALWWFAWLPTWRPPLREGERYGIDVSIHQGDIDWMQVAEDGIDFAYIKASEGGDFRDQRFAANWRGASEVDIDRGAYHFFTLCTDGEQQARNFLSVATPDREALRPAVDLELVGNCNRRPSAAMVYRSLRDFLQLVEDAWGTDALLYVGDDFEDRYPIRARLDRPLWLRRFLLRPVADSWAVWQLHGYARVQGISGRVDLDVMRGR